MKARRPVQVLDLTAWRRTLIASEPDHRLEMIAAVGLALIGILILLWR